MVIRSPSTHDRHVPTTAESLRLFPDDATSGRPVSGEPTVDKVARTPSGEAESAWSVFHGDALDAYDRWPSPSTIISDGAYGVGGFPDDPRTVDGLVSAAR